MYILLYVLSTIPAIHVEHIPTCTTLTPLEMSTQLEQYPTYKISIIQLTQESNLRDAPTLIGSGDLIVRWSSGQGRRYRTLEEISDCLVLPYRPSITDAIRTGEMMDTMVPFELGYLPTEGESQSGVKPDSFDPY